MTDIHERPYKKRRFFVDDEPHEPQQQHQQQPPELAAEPSLPDEINNKAEANGGADRTGQEQNSDKDSDSFDADTFRAVAGGDVPDAAIKSLQGRFHQNLEQAINAYFDGSWKTPSPQKPRQPPVQVGFEFPRSSSGHDNRHGEPAANGPASPPPSTSQGKPSKRYIGALGVAGWTTRSGNNLLKPGDPVRIERTKQALPQKVGRGGKPKPLQRRTQDVIVRFTNSRGEELGRLEKESATWISTLVDQRVCTFEGVCVFAPERIRTNDTVYLQLKVYILRSAFAKGSLVRPVENNRQTGLFETKETDDERDLRLRQIGLVKLFQEINLQPSKINETTARHKREGILQAAEVAEQYDNPESTQSKPKKTNSTPGTPSAGNNSGASSPTSGEDNNAGEEGEELEQDQLDSLYRKAQSFDFNTPTAEPSDTFTMDLRTYQKQALHWMLDNETLYDASSSGKASSGKETGQSMHPLWEEYLFPLTDVEEKAVERVAGEQAFYVNPYSGELGLEFPVMEQTCRGGILADEMGLGKTIEMLSLVHSHIAPEWRDVLDTGVGSGGKNGAPAVDAVGGLTRQPKRLADVVPAPCTTLVVAPMSLLAQWASEAEKASHPNTLKTLVYYGTDKNIDLQTLCSPTNAANAPNLIITSYGTVLSEYNAAASTASSNTDNGGTAARSKHTGLFSLDFWRLILDEAHLIKNRQSKTAKACYDLRATHRWVLTGTPIVNRLEDLFSLVRFLKVEPWSNFSFWKTFITTPFEKGDFVRALDVVQTVLEPLVLRRTKDMRTPSGEALVPLPPKTIEIERIEFSQPEREIYDHIYARAKRAFAQEVEKGTVMRSYTTIFAQILRLRQSCCHPVLTRNKAIVAEEEAAEEARDAVEGLGDDMDLATLLEKFQAEEGEQDAAKFGAHVLRQIQDEAEMECPICSEEPMEEQAVTGCWHSACKKCLLDYIEHQARKGEVPRCFNCREPINARDVFEVVKHEEESEGEGEGEGEAGAKENTQVEGDRLTAAMEVDGDVKGEEVQDDLYSSTQPPTTTTTINGSNNPHKPTPRISLRRVSQLSSAKITALTTHLKRLRKTTPRLKTVIFSQFTSFLDLLAPHLTTHHIHHLRFDGAMPQRDRARVLASFAAAPKFTVLLISLRAGGVGLNLTCAQRVFMMDPWWSFAVEAQAIDRVHRMGQAGEVKVVRLVVGGSIEEKMLRVQERKKFM